MDSILIVNFTGNHCVTVTDARGCENSTCVDLFVFELNLAVEDALLCEEGDSVTLSAPPGMVSYQWSIPANTQTITVTSPGTYSVTVVSAQGCIGSDAGVVSLDPMTVNATAVPSAINPNGVTTLTANVSNGSGAYDYSWTPVETVTSPASESTEASPQSTTIYQVLVTDLETGCTETDTAQVFTNVDIIFPDAFAPNGSPENRVFKPILDLAVKEFRIYNRWGQVVSENVTGWDGKFEGKEQPIGTYTYYIVVETANGTTKTQSGVFSLVR
jgi:gliding motility-associated-like protein